MQQEEDIIEKFKIIKKRQIFYVLPIMVLAIVVLVVLDQGTELQITKTLKDLLTGIALIVIIA